MSAVRRSGADVGLWLSFGTAVRLIVGWFCIMIGLLNLLAEADRRAGEPDLAYLVFHGMLVVGGIMLLGLSRLAADPGLVGYLAGGAVATIGLLVSALPATNSVCCMSAFGVRHGFPFTFLARNAGARWHADSQHLIADLLFWGFVGLLALIAVAWFRRVTARHDAAPPVAGAPNRHAEPTAHADQVRAEQPQADPPLPAGGTVGGLP